MEVVLLWLDDLDDLLFLALAAAERLRRVFLQIGLLASGALAGAERELLAPQLTSGAAGIAAASVGLWLTFAICGALADAANELDSAAA